MEQKITLKIIGAAMENLSKAGFLSQSNRMLVVEHGEPWALMLDVEDAFGDGYEWHFRLHDNEIIRWAIDPPFERDRVPSHK